MLEFLHHMTFPYFLQNSKQNKLSNFMAIFMSISNKIENDINVILGFSITGSF